MTDAAILQLWLARLGFFFVAVLMFALLFIALNIDEVIQIAERAFTQSEGENND